MGSYSLSVWTHPICAACWNARHPDQPTPLVAGDQRCCYCGRRRAVGLSLRENPARLACRGRHEAKAGACWHEPADPAAAETICWHCGLMIRRAYRDGEWKLNERLWLPALGRHAAGAQNC